jgi:small conductance mechanosensitive channel
MTEDPGLARLFNTLDSGALIELALILLAATLLIAGSQRFLPWLAGRLHGRAHYLVLALIPALRLLILLGAVLLVVPILIEPSLQNMVAVLGAVGLAVGFALKDYVSSLIAGVVATVELDYRPGDWIRVAGVYGEVKKVGMRTVQLVTPDDDLVSIPHLKLWSEPVHNANNGAPTLQCVADFYLHPDHDAAQVCRDPVGRRPDQPLPAARPAGGGGSPGAALGDPLPHPGLPDPPAPAVPLRHRPHRARQGRPPGCRGPPLHRRCRDRRVRVAPGDLRPTEP